MSGRGMQLVEALKEIPTIKIYGDTDDGTTSVLEIYDSNDVLIGKIDTKGFGRVEYRDEYVGGEWQVPQGVAAPDVVTVTIGGVPTRKYAFDGANTEESLSNTFEIAHDIPIALVNDGTLKLEWHIHGSASTTGAGNAKFFFDWCYKPVGAAPIAMTTQSVICEIGANEQYWHCIEGDELPVPEGGYAIGGVIEFKLRRTPTDDEDTYAGDFLLDKVALHVPTDKRGSRQRYIE